MKKKNLINCWCETCLANDWNNFWEEAKMDKKMHKVTKKMKTATKDMKEGKKKAAMKVLKGAEKANEKLVKYDKNVRDPEIKEYKKMKKKGC